MEIGGEGTRRFEKEIYGRRCLGDPLEGPPLKDLPWEILLGNRGWKEDLRGVVVVVEGGSERGSGGGCAWYK